MSQRNQPTVCGFLFWINYSGTEVIVCKLLKDLESYMAEDGTMETGLGNITKACGITTVNLLRHLYSEHTAITELSTAYLHRVQ